ncbi:hypothetical protein NUW58_g3215 [Xylaria curta]|uniref:Uncharacterized protein n=1 Tax=Xylaria curta TaxID=42375 RepID=A0ACC1PBZ3_9PEZI|nr:hypothetical protein NUW58_g3215 [Xylaria curta]
MIAAGCLGGMGNGGALVAQHRALLIPRWQPAPHSPALRSQPHHHSLIVDSFHSRPYLLKPAVPSSQYRIYPYSQSPAQRERFEVRVVTEGTLKDAQEGGAQTGRTIARLLPPGEEGVRIPRGIDIDLFWKVIEECCQRADEANAKKAEVFG